MSRVIKAVHWEAEPRKIPVMKFGPTPEELVAARIARDKLAAEEELRARALREAAMQSIASERGAKETLKELAVQEAAIETAPPPEAAAPDDEAAAKNLAAPTDFSEPEEAAKKNLADTEEKLAAAEKRLAEAEEIKAAAAQQLDEAKAQAERRIAEAKAAGGQQIDAAKAEAGQLIEEAKAQAAELAKDAEEKCRKLAEEMNETRQQAEADAAALKEEKSREGYDSGYAEGKEKGLADGYEAAINEQRDAINAANALAEKTIADAKAEKNKYMVEAERQIVDMVMDIANKVLPQHFIDAPQVILPLVRKAILKIKDQPEVVVRVAPSQYDLLLLAKQEFQSLLEGQATLEIKSDDSLAITDCVLESPSGNVDARLSVQMEAVEKNIRAALSVEEKDQFTVN